MVNLNLNFLENVAQNQYNRRESSDLLNVQEAASRSKDNETAVNAVIETAQKLGVTVTKEDIQRCHRVGKYKEGKMRPIVCKFRWYKKRMDFLTKKKKLRPNTSGLNETQRRELMKKTPFIAENLCPYRGKVFKFIRDYNRQNKLFAIVTTHNGMISCKKNVDDDKWINITSALDFEINGIPREEFEEEFDELFF